jgi:hypothetical protein
VLRGDARNRAAEEAALEGEGAQHH